LIVPAHWNYSPRIGILLHSNTLSWFQANQSLFLLFKVACLAEMQLTPIVKSLVWPYRCSEPRSTAPEANVNHYIIDAVSNKRELSFICYSHYRNRFSKKNHNNIVILNLFLLQKTKIVHFEFKAPTPVNHLSMRSKESKRSSTCVKNIYRCLCYYNFLNRFCSDSVVSFSFLIYSNDCSQTFA
jgi:hypothetical protein